MTTAIRDDINGATENTTFEQQTYRMSLESQAANHLTGNARINPESTVYRLDMARFSHLLPKYSTATLHRIIGSAPESSLNILAIIRSHSPDDEQLNDWISVERIHSEVGGLPTGVVKGIPQYKHIEKHDGANPQRREAQAKALVRVIMHFTVGTGYLFSSQVTGTMFDSKDKVKLISNENLSDLITTHDDPAAVADIITTRNLIDPESILSVLNTAGKTAHAITDGVL